MGFFKRLFRIFRKEPELNQRDSQVMEELQNRIGGKKHAVMPAGLQKQRPESFVESAKRQKQEALEEMKIRQELKARGYSASQIANTLLKHNEAKRLEAFRPKPKGK